MPRLAWLAAFLAVLVAACGPSTSVAPPSGANGIDGRWTGRAEDNLGAGRVTMDLTAASGNTLEGEVVLTFTLGLVSSSAEGTVEGSFESDRVALEIIPNDGKYCPYRATLTRDSETLTGTYEGVGCKEPINGTLSLKRQ